MSAAFSNAEVGDDNSLVINEGIPPRTFLVAAGVLLALAVLAWLVTRKGGG